jgi:cytochrome oxidase Cu insertion factor (SCO1/SenC/PrrC family)
MPNDTLANHDNPMTTTVKRRISPFFVTGSILWMVCLVWIVYGWYQWQQKSVTTKTESKSVESTEDDGRNPKQIKLVPTKDGGFVAKEVTDDDQDSPWDAEGIEDFSFTDTSGQTLTKKDLLGKPFIIAFVFTLCRGPCPNVTLQMREIQDRLKDYDFNLVTLTVDPQRDTIETLQKYGKDNGADFGRWKFLTGDQSDIYGLINRSFKMPVEEAKGASRQPGFEIIHSTNIMLVDDAGRVVGKYNAQKDDEMAKLRKDLKRVAKAKTDVKNVREGQQ